MVKLIPQILFSLEPSQFLFDFLGALSQSRMLSDRHTVTQRIEMYDMMLSDTWKLGQCLVTFWAGTKRLPDNGNGNMLLKTFLSRNRQCSDRILIHLCSALPSLTVWSEFCEPVWNWRLHPEPLSRESRDYRGSKCWSSQDSWTPQIVPVSFGWAIWVWEYIQTEQQFLVISSQ